MKRPQSPVSSSGLTHPLPLFEESDAPKSKKVVLVPRQASLDVPSLKFPPSTTTRSTGKRLMEHELEELEGHMPLYGAGPILSSAPLLDELTRPVARRPPPSWVRSVVKSTFPT